MKPTWTSSLSARFDNSTCWPLPEPDDNDGHGTCTHELRYAGYAGLETISEPASVSARARYHGADVIAAYEQLIAMPLSKSRDVLRALKAAAKMREEKAG
jgi:hypothetical protein